MLNLTFLILYDIICYINMLGNCHFFQKNTKWDTHCSICRKYCGNSQFKTLIFPLIFLGQLFLLKSCSNEMKICDNYHQPMIIQCLKGLLIILTARCPNLQITRDSMDFRAWIECFQMSVISLNAGICRGCIFVGCSIDVQWVVQNWFLDVIGCYNVFPAYRLVKEQNDCQRMVRNGAGFVTEEHSRHKNA